VVFLRDIEDASLFAESGFGDIEVRINSRTGSVMMRSSDKMIEFDEVPDEIWCSEESIVLPGGDCFAPGRTEMLRFARDEMGDRFHEAREAVDRGRDVFLQMVSTMGLTSRWYEFEKSEREKSIRVWCEENGISLKD
jgi:hypothetical protein